MLKFSGYDCDVRVDFFQVSGQKCISLSAANTTNNLSKDCFHGEPIAKASIFLEGQAINDNQTFIKDYSENKGMLAALVNGGIVKIVPEQTILMNDVYLVDILI